MLYLEEYFSCSGKYNSKSSIFLRQNLPNDDTLNFISLKFPALNIDRRFSGRSLQNFIIQSIISRCVLVVEEEFLLYYLQEHDKSSLNITYRIQKSHNYFKNIHFWKLMAGHQHNFKSYFLKILLQFTSPTFLQQVKI